MDMSNVVDLPSAEQFLMQEANAGRILTESQLRELLGKLDNTVAGSEVSLLYSGSFGEAKAWQIAEKIGTDSNGKIATIGQSEVGKLLNSDDFIGAVQETAFSEGRTLEDLLYGEGSNGSRIHNNSLSDYASKRYVEGIEGSVRLITNPDANPDGVFAKTELPAVRENTQITDIEGISKADFDARINELTAPGSGTSLSEALEIVRQDVSQTAAARVISMDIIEPVNAGSLAQSVGTNKAFEDIPNVFPTAIADGTAGKVSVAALVGKDTWHNWTGTLGKFSTEAAELAHKAGIVGTVLGVTLTISEAYAAAEAGDYDEASVVIAKFAGETAGGYLAGVGVAVVAAPLVALAGAPAVVGAVLVGGLSLVAGIAGGEAGGALSESGMRSLIKTSKDLGLIDNGIIADYDQAMANPQATIAALPAEVKDGLAPLMSSYGSEFLQGNGLSEHYRPVVSEDRLADLLNVPNLDAYKQLQGNEWINENTFTGIDGKSYVTIEKDTQFFRSAEPLDYSILNPSNADLPQINNDVVEDIDTTELFKGSYRIYPEGIVYKTGIGATQETIKTYYIVNQAGHIIAQFGVPYEIPSGTSFGSFGENPARLTSWWKWAETQDTHVTYQPSGGGVTGGLILALSTPINLKTGDTITNYKPDGSSESFTYASEDTLPWLKDKVNETAFLNGDIITPVDGSDINGALIKPSASANIDNNTYIIRDVAKSIQNATDELMMFVKSQSSKLEVWFLDESQISLSLAEWLGSNMQDLVHGNMDAEEALIDIAKFLGQRFLADSYVVPFTRAAASVTLAEVFTALDIPADLSLKFGVAISEALGRMAVDFVLNSGGWDHQDYINAGITTITSALTYTYLSSILKSTVVVGTAVAGVTAAVAGLLNSGEFDGGDWANLGVQIGIAAGSYYAGVSLATLIASGSLVGPAGIVIGALTGVVAGDIFSSLIGSKRFYEGEFTNAVSALNSLYQLQYITDSNGNQVPALVSVKPEGSTIIAQGVTTIIGNSGQDVLVGNEGLDDIMLGGAGADYLEGKSGNDNIVGEANSDHIAGNEGNDYISGGVGDDVLFGDAGEDKIIADTGDDFVHMGSGDDITATGDGRDIIMGGAGSDAIQAGADDDLIDAGAGNDEVEAGAGDDLVLGNLGADNIKLGEGHDSAFGESGNDQLYGGKGNDTLNGGAGIDLLQGDTGNDYLIGEDDDDFLDGGLGNDTLSGDDGDDVLTGGLDDDLLAGGAGNDALTGHDGNDLLIGNAGADTLKGDAGDDVYYLTNDASDISNRIIDLAGNDTLLLPWLDEGNLPYLTLTQDNNDLQLSYHGVELGTIVDHFAGKTIETLEIKAGKTLSLSNLTIVNGIAVTPAVQNGSGASAYSQALTKLENANQSLSAQAHLYDNALVRNLSEVGYNESLADALETEFYNAEELVSFKRKRGKLGGHYTVYKLEQDTTVEGTEQKILTLHELTSGSDTSHYHRIITNASKVKNTYEISYRRHKFAPAESANVTVTDYYENSERVATNVQVNGQSGEELEVYQTANGNVTVSGGATNAFGQTYSTHTTYTAAARLATGQVTQVTIGLEFLKTGTDKLVGAWWNELVQGYSGDDILVGNGGNDTLDGGSGNDWIFGGAGNDTAYGRFGDDIIFGNDGNDLLQGNEHGDAIVGGAGHDSLYGHDGEDWLDGGSDDDSIFGDGGDDALWGSEGRDSLYGGAGNDLLDGGKGNDFLDGEAGNDVLKGGIGNDTLKGSQGEDTMDGGSGEDNVRYQESTSAVTVNLQTGIGSGGLAEGDRYQNIEVVIGSSYGDRITGDNGDNIIKGAAGADTLDGGAGIDKLAYDGSASAVTVNLTSNTASGGDATGDVIQNFENISGSSFNDILTGSSIGNLLMGEAGNDSLMGAGGDDTLRGGIGADTLNGGSGNDTASYQKDTSGVNVNLAIVTAQSAGEAAGDVLSSIENVIGGFGNDSLYGSVAANLLDGGAGNDILKSFDGDDILYGKSGNDTMTAGVGNDSVYGGYGNDRYQWEAGHGNDTLQEEDFDGVDELRFLGGLTFQDFLFGSNVAQADNLLITHMGTGETITILGQLGNNPAHYIESYLLENGSRVQREDMGVWWNGSASDDELKGLAGRDTFQGGVGDDTLQGMQGKDIYLWDIGDGNDTIIESGTDVDDTLRIRSGITLNELDISVTITGDMQVRYTPTGETVTIKNQFHHDTKYQVERLVLNDGTDYSLLGSFVWRDTEGNDILTGSDFDDILRFGLGYDHFMGGAGNDKYVWSAGNGNDAIDESGSGGSSNDILRLTGGIVLADLEFSASINRSLVVRYIPTDETITIVNQFHDDTTYRVEKIQFDDGSYYNLSQPIPYVGTQGGDGLSGSSANDTIFGAYGNDHINGYAGDDILTGGAGSDTLYGGIGNDIFRFSRLADSTYSAYDQIADFSLANDRINVADLGFSSLVTSSYTTVGQLRMYYDGTTSRTYVINDQAGFIFYLKGNYVSELGNNHFIWGNNIIGSINADTLSGTAYNEEIIGDNGNDILSGGNGADKLYGQSGNDFLDGGEGNDVLDGGEGTDTLQGGAGDDTYLLTDLLDVLVEGTNAGIDIIDSENTDIRLVNNIENAILHGFTSLHISGNNLTNLLKGNVNSNRITGDSGNDTIYGYNGNDSLYGGSGNDSVFGGDGSDNLHGGDGNDWIVSGKGYDTLDGGEGRDTLIGGDGADVFRFSSLLHSLDDDGANNNQYDAIMGFQAGLDKIDLAGLGFTALDDDGGSTEAGELRLAYSNSSNRTYVRSDQVDFEFYLDGDYTNALTNNDFIFKHSNPQESIRGVIIGTPGADTLVGSALNEFVTGSAGDDSLKGENGNDLLDGGEGQDVLTGGGGKDIFRFSSLLHSLDDDGANNNRYDCITDFQIGVDKIDVTGLGFTSLIYSGSTSNGELRIAYSSSSDRTYIRSDQVDFEFYLDGNYTNTLSNEDFIFASGATNLLINSMMMGATLAETLSGGESHEYLYGLDGNDTLDGSGGDDILDGAAGKDKLTGGAGADVFRFSDLTHSVHTGSNYDRVTDFEVAIDKFDLKGLGFTGLDTDGGSTEAGELRLSYSSTSNRTYVRSDQMDFEFYLDGDYTATLTEASFLF